MDSSEDGLKRGGFPTRFLVAILGAVGLLPIVGARKIFALVMTHLTSSFEDPSASEELVFTQCTEFNTSRDSHVDMGGDTMFLLHAVYYAGMPLLKVAGTVLSTRVSPKLVITSVVMTSSLITLCTPNVITASIPLLFVLRLVQGALDGIQQPCNSGLLSAWSTAKDKALLFCIYYTGAYCAPAVAALFSAATMCYVSWNASLYVYGCVGVLWSCVWAGIIYDTPDTHPSLSSAQRDLHRQHGAHVQPASTQRSIPWRHILTSLPVWSAFIGSFGHTYVYAMLVVQQTQYFSDSFRINIADIGLLTTIPHVGLSVMCLFGGVVSQRLFRLGLPVTQTRKLIFSIGKVTEGCCLVGLFFTTDWRVAVALITVGVTLGGLAEAGYQPLPADMAPQLAGVVAGVVSMGALGAFVSTVVASFLVKGRRLEDWQKLFLIAGLLDLLAVMMFCFMADARPQPWDSGLDPSESSHTHTSREKLLQDHDLSDSEESPERPALDCEEKYGLLDSEVWAGDADTMRLVKKEGFGEETADVVSYGTCTPGT